MAWPPPPPAVAAAAPAAEAAAALAAALAVAVRAGILYMNLKQEVLLDVEASNAAAAVAAGVWFEAERRLLASGGL